MNKEQFDQFIQEKLDKGSTYQSIINALNGRPPTASDYDDMVYSFMLGRIFHKEHHLSGSFKSMTVTYSLENKQSVKWALDITKKKYVEWPVKPNRTKFYDWLESKGMTRSFKTDSDKAEKIKLWFRLRGSFPVKEVIFT